MLLANTYAQSEVQVGLLLGATFVVAMLLSVIPVLSYPFRLLFTIIHELSHGLMAIFTGGHFVRFVLTRRGSGVATTAGGIGCLILPAGYLGTTLFSAGLILLGSLAEVAPYILGTIGGLLILLILWYGRSSVMALVSGLLLGLVLIWVAWRADEVWSVFLLNLLAFRGGLTAVDDLRSLTRITRWNLPLNNDASAMAQLVGCPALIWALVWFALSITILGATLWFTWLREAPGF